MLPAGKADQGAQATRSRTPTARRWKRPSRRPAKRPRAKTQRRSSRPIGELEQASHALSKTLYETARAAGPAGGPQRRSGDGKPAGRDDEAIDAEFEVKKE